MDYEQKYKDALERAREWHNDQHITIGLKGNLEEIFPELKESENERIKKEILSFLKDFERDHYKNLDFSPWIAWLEKQGEKSTIIDIDKMVKEYSQTKDGDFGFPVNCMIRAYRQGINDALRLSLNLEKQGEQILANSAKTCKVEPKFKVGDWVIYDENVTMRIVNVEDSYYEVEYTDGGKAFPNMDFVDKNSHLWTIQNAKDGDVLVSAGVIFIFNKVDGKWISCHCSLHKDKSFINEDFNLMHIKYSNEVYPATKEQRDSLIKAMTEAGYVFDFNKRELKKVNSDVQSNKDEDIATAIITGELLERNGFEHGKGRFDDCYSITLSDKTYIDLLIDETSNTKWTLEILKDCGDRLVKSIYTVEELQQCIDIMSIKLKIKI